MLTCITISLFKYCTVENTLHRQEMHILTLRSQLKLVLLRFSKSCKWSVSAGFVKKRRFGWGSWWKHYKLMYTKDVNESQNARVSKKVFVLENLTARWARNSRKQNVKLCLSKLTAIHLCQGCPTFRLWWAALISSLAWRASMQYRPLSRPCLSVIFWMFWITYTSYWHCKCNCNVTWSMYVVFVSIKIYSTWLRLCL